MHDCDCSADGVGDSFVTRTKIYEEIIAFTLQNKDKVAYKRMRETAALPTVSYRQNVMSILRTSKGRGRREAVMLIKIQLGNKGGVRKTFSPTL